MSTIKAKLFSEVAEPGAKSNNKVTVVGIGQVGMACAFSILTQVSIIRQFLPFDCYKRTQIKFLFQFGSITYSNQFVLIFFPSRRMYQVNWRWLMWLLIN